FDQVLETANHELVCYVNSDIILLSDFLQAVRQVNLARFLLVGQRWDLDINRNWGFQGAWEEKKLRRLTADYGELHPPSGSDYFVFQRNSRLGKLPPFAVGRPGWDNWLIYRARYLRIPVIDMTRVTTVIHQNHNYNHVQQKEGDAWEGPEARENRRLAGGSAYVFTLQDVDKILTREGLRKPKRTIEHLSRQAETIPVLYPRLRFVARYVNRTIKIMMAVYLKVTKSITR
ncbi:MAG: hypothetical protein KAV87_13690, partial [Desulfobacteraceae bacterium]|nr:hypothetical protein [Desulfobacteraceae bacterium]